MTLVGVSLKMYFSHARTLDWVRQVVDIAERHPAVRSGAAELFVVPTFPALVPVRSLLDGSPVLLGVAAVLLESCVPTGRSWRRSLFKR